MIVLIGGEKGGTGKTTLATNLATLLALAGRDVLLVDSDAQASANYWAQNRDELGLKPRIACVQKLGKSLAAELNDLATRYQDIIVDAGGRNSVELRSALVAVDKVYLPIQPSQFDVWTLHTMNNLIETAKAFNSELQATVIVNRASTNRSVQEAQETLRLLTDFPHLQASPLIIKDRIAYRKAAKEGLAVNELKPKELKASEEITKLFNEIFL